MTGPTTPRASRWRAAPRALARPAALRAPLAPPPSPASLSGAAPRRCPPVRRAGPAVAVVALLLPVEDSRGGHRRRRPRGHLPGRPPPSLPPLLRAAALRARGRPRDDGCVHAGARRAARAAPADWGGKLGAEGPNLPREGGQRRRRPAPRRGEPSPGAQDGGRRPAARKEREAACRPRPACGQERSQAGVGECAGGGRHRCAARLEQAREASRLGICPPDHG